MNKTARRVSGLENGVPPIVELENSVVKAKHKIPIKMNTPKEQARIMDELLREGWTWSEAFIHSQLRFHHSERRRP